MTIHVTIGQVMTSPEQEKKMSIEKMMLDVTDKNPNMLVPWYLMAAYAYYVEDDPILSDASFDRMGRKLAEHWKDIDHFHKDHINEDDLKAGTFLGEYPSRVKYGLEEVRRLGYVT